MRNILAIIFVILTMSGHSQTFNGGGGSIPDDGNYVVFPITVSGLSQTSLNQTFGLESVCFDAVHTWIDDLTIILIAPDGTQVVLAEHNGGDSDLYTATCLDDNSPVSINAAGPPYTGSFRPEEDLGYMNNGQNGNGIWYLYVIDTYPFADAGTLNHWSITFGTDPATITPFVSSNLPVVVMNTNGQNIEDDPRIVVDFALIDNGPGIRNYLTDPPVYNNHVSIEIRGSSSQMFPKKGYGFETCDSAGTEVDVAWLGMPIESDWILNANYSDKTLMRNSITYHVWNQMGHYASRCSFCEVMINGMYKGVYIFMEKIKRDNNRVDIAKLLTTDNSGDELTGGYIFKIDKSTGSGGDGWVSNFLPPVNGNGQTIFFQYEYPDADDITIQQKAYIQAYVDSFETALAGSGFSDPVNGFRKYASDNSFIDFFIINELSKNIDGYRLSTFLHKDKNSNGGKLKIGPVWDFDLAWRNADYYGGDDYTGWAYQFDGPDDYWQVPFWWQRFLEDSLFTNDLKCRWEELRATLLSETSLFAYIDSIAFLIDEGKERNFETWMILGSYVWPNPSPIPTTYAGEVQNLKNWITNRLTWMDSNLPGVCTGTSINTQQEVNSVSIFPNPADRQISIEASSLIQFYSISDLTGKELISGSGDGKHVQVDISGLNPGVYLVTILTEERSGVQKLVVR